MPKYSVMVFCTEIREACVEVEARDKDEAEEKAVAEARELDRLGAGGAFSDRSVVAMEAASAEEVKASCPA